MSWVTPRVVDVARADQTDPSTGPFLQDLTFAGPGIDRDADARTDPDLLPKLLADSATRVLPLRAGRSPTPTPTLSPFDRRVPTTSTLRWLSISDERDRARTRPVPTRHTSG
jgi:hypothetical protein